MKTFSLHWGSGVIEEEAQIETHYHRPTIQLLKFTSGQAVGTYEIRFCAYTNRGRFQPPALIVAAGGFGEPLEIGRERKFELYDLNIAKPEPLVPRNLRLEVDERLKADGSVRQPLDRTQLLARVEHLVAGGVRSIAVVFLHAYANPRHEAEALRLIAEHYPQLYTSASHEVAPEIREFERASTTVANAYIKPLAHQYLGRMARQLAEQRIPAPLLLMLSSGGLAPVAEAQRRPVQMLESGPGAGAR